MTFRLGTDLDTAQVQTQNRVSQAETRLPLVVRQIGLVTQKRSPDLTMVVFLHVPRRPLRLAVPAQLRGHPDQGRAGAAARRGRRARVRLGRLRDASVARSGKIAARGMTVDDVLDAVREQNTEVAAGQIGGQPALPGTRVLVHRECARAAADRGRVRQHRRSRRGDERRVVYLRDVARIELGPETYALRSMLDGRASVGIPVFQLPGANALELSDAVRSTMKELAKSFPEGVSYDDRLRSDGVRAQLHRRRSIDTLLEAVALVVLVVVVFLQSWRASVVPLVAVPVAIIGTLAILLLLGFSINSLTLFGLVLATGIVVDDAIVVVENVERKMEDGLGARGSGARRDGRSDAARSSRSCWCCARSSSRSRS